MNSWDYVPNVIRIRVQVQQYLERKSKIQLIRKQKRPHLPRKAMTWRKNHLCLWDERIKFKQQGTSTRHRRLYCTFAKNKTHHPVMNVTFSKPWKTFFWSNPLKVEIFFKSMMFLFFAETYFSWQIIFSKTNWQKIVFWSSSCYECNLFKTFQIFVWLNPPKSRDLS